MKKFFALLLALMLTFTLVACGGGNEEVDPDAPAFVADLQNSNKIIIATSPDYPPYEYYDDAGNITGFDYDAINKVIEILNTQNGTNLEVEWVAMDFSTIISAVQVGQADIGVSCFTYDPERDVLFSEPYLKSAQVIVVPAGSDITAVDQIAGKKVGAGPGTTGWAAAEALGAEMASMGDYVQMFEILRNGGLDAIACDEAVGLKYGEMEDFVVLEGKLVDEEVSIIAENSNTALTDALNAAIAEFMASDDYNNLKVEYGLN